MPRIKLNAAGKVFGLLTAVEMSHRLPCGHSVWRCVCSCGKEVLVRWGNLRAGNTKSCGCLSSKSRVESNKKHGKYGTPTYISWAGMKSRCNNPNNEFYSDYGGRGISVCSEWCEFDAFYRDMGDRPSGKSLERLDVNGNYCPENCVWATAEQQARNTRRNRFVKVGDKSMTHAEFERSVGLYPGAIYDRLRRGWSIEEALTV